MIDEKTKEAAEAILAKDRCVELRPIKDGGVTVLEVIRHKVQVKSEPTS